MGKSSKSITALSSKAKQKAKDLQKVSKKAISKDSSGIKTLEAQKA